MAFNLKPKLSNLLNETITNISPISGGDVSTAFRIRTQNNAYFLKTNNMPEALTMFKKEANSLSVIAQTNTIKTPLIISCDTFEDLPYLLLEYIKPKSPSTFDFKTLGKQLAKLHQCSSNYFGLDEDNFIGRLPQNNNQHNTWLDFYTHERLLPQLELAQKKGLLKEKACPSIGYIKEQLQPLFEHIKPSLLHGDLWSGNYLIATDGTPYVIDPAIYYGHHEVDIAISKLFGGFEESFYSAYHDCFPMDYNTKARIDIYQLYYLLVHLNMFGASYYGSVSTILKTYF